MDIQIETITPEAASTLLDQAEGVFQNRSLRRRLLDKLVRDIQSGAWVLNGESIKLDRSGVLVDGQHRLHACVQANRPIDTLVVRGVPKEAHRTIDHGATRSFSDTLKMEGHKYAVGLAAGCGVIWRVENGRMTSPSDTELLAVARAHPGLADWVPKLNNEVVLRRLSGGVSVVTGLFTLFSEIDEDLAQKLFLKVARGLGFENETDPAYCLRKVLEKTQARRGGRTPREVIAAWYIKTWNDLREGKSRRLLLWRRVEGFPAIEGLPTPD